MNLLGGTILVVVVVVCIKTSSGNFWANRKVHCAVSVWSDWTASAPGGTRHRTRTIMRNNRNGGNPCPTLEETMNRTDPWDRQGVPTKFHNKFMTGQSSYYSFIRPQAMRTERSSSGIHREGSSVIRVGGSIQVTLLPRDLLFIVDMSGSISGSSWTLTKQKLADLIERLCGKIGPGRQNNRIAIVTFSSRVILNFNFRTYWTIASVRQAILGMRQDRQQTCTGDALKFAHDYMFKPKTGIRSATKSVKEVLVLTDGESNCGANLPQAVKILQVKAFVFALAIGNYNDQGRKEIESMVSYPLMDHIFSLARFEEFRKMVDIIKTYPGKCVPFELS